MGNEESTMVDDSTRPSVLEGRNLEAIAKYIKEHDVKRIVVMVCLQFPASHSRHALLTPDHRLEQASVLRQAFRISVHRILGSTPI